MPRDEALHAVFRSLLDRVDLDDAARTRIVDETERYAGAAAPDRPVVALVAVNLDRYYTSLEATFEAVARMIDGVVPAGSGWHQSLLEQMENPSDARPAVLRGETRSALTALLRFRHFLRHAYAVDFDWNKLKPLAVALSPTHALVARDLADFRGFLTSCLAHL